MDDELGLRDPLPPLSRGLPASLLVLAGATLVVLGVSGSARPVAAFGLGPVILCLGLLRFVGRSVRIDRTGGVLRMRIGPFGVGPESRQPLEDVTEVVLARLPVPGRGPLSACPSIRLRLVDGRQLVVHVNPDAAGCRHRGERLATALGCPLKDEL